MRMLIMKVTWSGFGLLLVVAFIGCDDGRPPLKTCHPRPTGRLHFQPSLKAPSYQFGGRVPRISGRLGDPIWNEVGCGTDGKEWSRADVDMGRYPFVTALAMFYGWSETPVE